MKVNIFWILQWLPILQYFWVILSSPCPIHCSYSSIFPSHKWSNKWHYPEGAASTELWNSSALRTKAWVEKHHNTDILIVKGYCHTTAIQSVGHKKGLLILPSLIFAYCERVRNKDPWVISCSLKNSLTWIQSDTITHWSKLNLSLSACVAKMAPGLLKSV